MSDWERLLGRPLAGRNGAAMTPEELTEMRRSIERQERVGNLTASVRRARALLARVEELEKLAAAVWELEREYHTQEGDSCSWDRAAWPCAYAKLGATLRAKP